MKKIEYSTHYDDTNRICGYVMAKEEKDHYTINERQYKMCLKNRTVGGDAGIKFHSDKPVYVVDKNYVDRVFIF